MIVSVSDTLFLLVFAGSSTQQGGETVLKVAQRTPDRRMAWSWPSGRRCGLQTPDRVNRAAGSPR